MKLNISVKDAAKPRVFSFSIPRWFYMNSLGVSLIAMKKDVPVSPRQARKALRAVKMVMRQQGISRIAEVEVCTKAADVTIDL